MIRSFFFLIILVCYLPSFGKTIPVCSQCTFNSIQKALAMAQNGDSILIKKGIYKEKNLLIQKSLTLLGENYPILDGEFKYEILTIDADNVVISGLQIQNTGHSSLNDLAGIKVLSSEKVSIIDNYLLNNFFGIYFQNSKNCFIHKNFVKGNTKTEQDTGNGIHLWKCSQITIDRNYIAGHRDGIYFEFVTQSVVKNNRSENNIRYGLHFMFSNDDQYYYNVFKSNGAGVAVMYTKNVTMVDNLFEQNWGSASYGILLKDISDSKITCNRFFRNTVGIYMEGSSRIEMLHNEFSENGWAIRLQASCENVLFEKNNFLSNSFDIATNGETMLNQFIHNYWDKYEGYDLNRDQKGDVPYHPVSLFSMIAEQNPQVMLLYRSFMVYLLDRAERTIPSLTPEKLKDTAPMMKKIPI